MDIAVDNKTSSRRRIDVLVTWKRLVASWELYPLLALAAFTRFYHLDLTEFDADQADIFRMAHDAVSHGHLVATSNIASLGIYNPPAIVYLLMIPAALSANPLGGAIFTALLGLIAVLFSYIVVRRYYGRLTAAITAALFGTTSLAVSYARFMWNQNLLPLFVLFFIASLFWGVVERRKGWLGPAMILLGLLIQLHGTGLLMGLPFVVALLLAPRSTLRWRDLFLGIFGLLVLYAPYLLWLVYSNYRDIHYLLTTPITNQTSIDDQALNTYLYFLHPAGNQATPSTALIYPLARYSDLVSRILVRVLFVGLVLSIGWVLWSPGLRRGVRSLGLHNPLKVAWRYVNGWCLALRASPTRCSFLLLLAWQAPVLTLIRHTVYIFPHYFIIYLPGQFILVGLAIAKMAEWCLRREKWGRIPYTLFCVLTVLVVVFQFATIGGELFDWAHGRFYDGGSGGGYYNTLNSLEHAVNEADHLAQQRHLSRVYIAADNSILSAMRYLAGQMHTPSTVSRDTCLMMPGPASGPAVLLVAPYSLDMQALASQYAHAQLIDSPSRLGGAPFRLYIVNPLTPLSQAPIDLSHQLTYFGAQPFRANGNSWQVARWGLQHSAQPSDNTTYTYQVFSHVNGQSNGGDRNCDLSAMRAGDQFLTIHKQPAQKQAPLTLGVYAYVSSPFTFSPKLVRPFITFDTFYQRRTASQLLQGPDGKNSITISPS